MSHCVQCGLEVVSEGKKPKRFCSDACRKKYKRTQETDNLANGHEETDITQETDIVATLDEVCPVDTVEPAIECPTPEEWDSLPAGVARPREDSPEWVHSADYARTIWRLLHWTINQLQEARQWIPAWRVGWEATL